MQNSAFQQTNSQSLIYQVSIRYPEAKLLISGSWVTSRKRCILMAFSLKWVTLFSTQPQLAAVQLSGDRYRRQ